MPAQKILIYPHPLLKKLCQPVRQFDAEIDALVLDLLDTMRAGPGSVGVAAPQIGVLLRVCVIDVSGSKLGRDNNHGLLVLVNPEIIGHSEAREEGWEGCLSIPDIRGMVPRLTDVTVKALDRNGRALELRLKQFPARVAQHETDHLAAESLSPGQVAVRVQVVEDLVEDGAQIRRRHQVAAASVHGRPQTVALDVEPGSGSPGPATVP